MTTLSSRFVVLAAFCALAALPGSTAEARAIISRHHETGMLATSPSGILTARTDRESPVNQKTDTVPVIPLPNSMLAKTSTESTKNNKGKTVTQTDSTDKSSKNNKDERKDKKKSGKRVGDSYVLLLMYSYGFSILENCL